MSEDKGMDENSDESDDVDQDAIEIAEVDDSENDTEENTEETAEITENIENIKKELLEDLNNLNDPDPDFDDDVLGDEDCVCGVDTECSCEDEIVGDGLGEKEISEKEINDL